MPEIGYQNTFLCSNKNEKEETELNALVFENKVTSNRKEDTI